MSKYKKIDFTSPHYLRYVDETNLDKRILDLDSAFNMRDIGGYTNSNGKQIKWGKIYRGEEIRHLTDDDFRKFEDLNITHVIDFRGKRNTIYYPDRIPEGAEHVVIDILDGLEMRDVAVYWDSSHDDANKYMRILYEEIIKHKASDYAKALKILADDPDAIIYTHCTNGKDRTGAFIALIMLIAGIDEEKIISDYSLTNRTVDKAYETLTGSKPPESVIRDLYAVNPDWLQLQLDYIRDNYGDVDNYLISNTDLTKQDLDNIRKNVLE